MTVRMKLRLYIAIVAILAIYMLAPGTWHESRGQEVRATNTSFAVIGDSGTGEPPQFEIARQMVATRRRIPFDFVIMLGDNIYGGGKPTFFKPRFEDPYKELLAAGVKFYASLGNHDSPYAEEHSKYEKFNMGGNRYYSFVKGDGLLEFFALDTNDNNGAGVMEDQLGWLEGALKQSKAVWKVVFFHHAIYASGKMHPPYLQLRAQLEPLFITHKVNVVFSGHYHVYERLKPQKGVHYYVAGSGGKLMKGDLDRASTLTAAGNDQTQIFLIVEVDREAMKVTALDARGKVVDSSVVKREEH
jgi:Calcineurin-like phosphoesterase